MWIATLVFVAVVLLAWVLQLIGLPGNWLIVAAAAVYAWWIGVASDYVTALGWPTLFSLFALAVLGELVELLAGMAGVSQAGGSRRGALLALVGSILGGVVGMFAGLPIPIIGSLLAAVFFAAAGAFAGAFLGEHWKRGKLDASLQVGQAAFKGRLLGTVAKMAVCTVMVLVALVALVV